MPKQLAPLPIDVLAFLEATEGFTTVEVGAYIRLLFHEWRHGTIPTDKKKLQKIIGLTGTAFFCVWEQEDAKVRKKFYETSNSSKTLQNPRLEKERAASIPAASKSGIDRFGDIRMPFGLRAPAVLAAVNRWAEHSWLQGQVQPMTFQAQLTEFKRRGGKATIEIIERSIRDGARKSPYWEPYASGNGSSGQQRRSPEEYRRWRHRRREEQRSLLEDAKSERMTLEDDEPSMLEQFKRKRANS